MAKYSIIKEDEKTFHVHDGKQHFLVAKNGLPKAMHEQIRGMPKYALGGMVESGGKEDDGLPEFLTKPLYQQDIKQAVVDSTPAVASTSPVLNLPPEQTQVASPAPASTAAPIVDSTTSQASAIELPATTEVKPPQNPYQQTLYNEYVRNQKQQMAGIETEQLEKAKAAEEQATLAQRFYGEQEEKRVRAELEANQKLEADLAARNEQLFNDSLNNKINPNRVWQNMGTGNRILAAISLVLGGAASGGRADNNAALNTLNAAIDRDIKAQMEDRSNQNTLYAHNLQKYRDAHAAVAATKMELLSIAQGQAAMITNKHQSEIAKAQGQQLVGAIANQGMEMKEKLLQGAANARAIQGNSVNAKIAALPKDLQDNAYKEIGEWQATEANVERFKKVFARSVELSGLEKSVMSPLQTSALRKTMRAQLYPIARQIAGPGAFTEAEANAILDPMLASMTNDKKTNQEILANGIETLRAMGSSKTPILSQYNIVPGSKQVDFVPRGK